MNKFRKLLLGAGAILAVVALTACGGSDDKKSDSGVLNGGSSSGNSSSSSSGSSSGQTQDLSKSAKSIQDLKSFNFDVSLKLDLGDLGSLGGSTPSSGSSSSNDLGAGIGAMLGLLGNVKATGSYVGPDQYSVTASLMGQQFSMVQIGKKSWTRQGANGKWTEESASDSPLGSFSPSDLSSATDSLPADTLKKAKTSKETVNGMKTTRYSFDRKALMELAKEDSSTSGSADTFDQFDKAQMDIWLNDDGIPVKMSIDMSGKDEKKKNIGIQMELNLKDLNSDSIKIKSPV